MLYIGFNVIGHKGIALWRDLLLFLIHEGFIFMLERDFF